MKQFVIVVLMASVFALGCSSSDQAGAAESAETAVAQQATSTPAVDTEHLRAAPAWQLLDLNGQVVKSAEFDGKVTILDFWATWCGPCRMEIPHFIDLTNTYGDDLAIVGVAMDRQGPAIVAPFVAKNQVNYTTVIGDQRIVQDFAPIRGLPTTFVISQDGKIFKRYVGFRPREVFEADIRTLLGKES